MCTKDHMFAGKMKVARGKRELTYKFNNPLPIGGLSSLRTHHSAILFPAVCTSRPLAHAGLRLGERYAKAVQWTDKWISLGDDNQWVRVRVAVVGGNKKLEVHACLSQYYVFHFVGKIIFLS